MGVHYFHCTDGVDLIIDRQGRDARADRDVVVRARKVAAEIMRSVPAYRDWDDWSVHVYDERGELEIVPFPDALASQDDCASPDALAADQAGL